MILFLKILLTLVIIFVQSACTLNASLSDLASQVANSVTPTPSPTPVQLEFTVSLSSNIVTTTTSDQNVATFLTVTLNQVRSVDTVFSLIEYSPDGASAADYDLAASTITILAGQTSAQMALLIEGKSGSKDFDKRVNLQFQTSDTDFAVQSRTTQFTITDSNALVLTVNPMYPVNGANWNDYIAPPASNLFFRVSPYLRVPTSLFPTDTACTAICAHAGELRKVLVSSKTSCNNLSMSDSVGAFEWRCEDSQSPLFFYSVGFKKGKGLSDLLLSDGSDWRSLSVTLSENSTNLSTSAASKWWGNTIETINAAQMNPTSGNPRKFLNSAGKVYVLTQSSASTGVEITADKVSLVTLPGVTLSSSTTLTASSNCFTQNCLLMTKNNFSWFEVKVSHAISGTYALKVESFKYNTRIHRSEITGSANALGIYISGIGSIISQSKISNLLTGISYASSTAFNTVNNSEFSKLTTAVHNSGSSYGVTYNSKFFANTNAIYFNAVQLMTVQSVLISHSTKGIDSIFSSASFSVSNSLFVNNTDGIIDDSILNLNSISIINSSGAGLQAKTARVVNTNLINNNKGYVSTNNQAATASETYSLTSANNITNDIEFSNSAQNHYFYDSLNLGSGSSRCVYGTGLTNIGLTSANCLTAGMSSINRAEGISTSSLYEGFKNDTLNAHGSNGASGELYSNITDYFNFENWSRVWSKYNATFTWPSSDLSGSCSGGNCGIFDYSLKANANYLKNANGVFAANQACPATVKGSVHFQIIQNLSSFSKSLRYAVEYTMDGKGNDNGMCEANEYCYFVPDNGSYLVEPEKFTQTCIYDADGDSDLVGITIYGQ